MTVARVLALVLLAGAAGHQPAPLTPGAVALLDAADSAARDTLLRAVADDDALVRTVAARLVAIQGDAALNEAIARQWAALLVQDRRVQRFDVARPAWRHPALDVHAIHALSGWKFAPSPDRDAPVGMGFQYNYAPPR